MYYQFSMTSVDNKSKSKSNVTFVSGGSDGADTSAILAGNAKQVPVVGYIKRHTVPETLQCKYSEMFVVEKNPAKDMCNVDLSNLVIAFRLNQPKTGMGTDRTVEYALHSKYTYVPQVWDEKYANEVCVLSGKRPVVLVWDLNKNNLSKFVEQTKEVIAQHKPKFIMVSEQN